jgi:hypothetical protein
MYRVSGAMEYMESCVKEWSEKQSSWVATTSGLALRLNFGACQAGKLHLNRVSISRQAFEGLQNEVNLSLTSLRPTKPYRLKQA